MNPAEVLLISQVAALVMQGVTALIASRKQLAANATQADKENLDQAHANFQAVVAAASATLAPAK